MSRTVVVFTGLEDDGFFVYDNIDHVRPRGGPGLYNYCLGCPVGQFGDLPQSNIRPIKIETDIELVFYSNFTLVGNRHTDVERRPIGKNSLMGQYVKVIDRKIGVG